MPSDRFTTGSFGLDLLMGGGWKRGAVNEVWGGPGSGKTMLMKQTLQNRHITDRTALWVDTGPHTHLAADPSLLYIQPGSAEQAFRVLFAAADTGFTSFAIVDDANHLVRQAELDGDPDYAPDEHREFKEELNTLKVKLDRSGTGVIFLSQPRDTQRAPIRGTGISEKAAERISLQVVRAPQSGEVLVKATRKVTGHSTQYWVVPGKGIDRTRELVQYGERTGVIIRKGSWYECEFLSRKLRWQGAPELQDWLDNALDPYAYRQLEKRISAKWAERGNWA